jgi:ABC-type molybdate transport system substrate-binding protein
LGIIDSNSGSGAGGSGPFAEQVTDRSRGAAVVLTNDQYVTRELTGDMRDGETRFTFTTQ